MIVQIKDETLARVSRQKDALQKRFNDSPFFQAVTQGVNNLATQFTTIGPAALSLLASAYDLSSILTFGLLPDSEWLKATAQGVSSDISTRANSMRAGLQSLLNLSGVPGAAAAATLLSVPAANTPQPGTPGAAGPFVQPGTNLAVNTPASGAVPKPGTPVQSPAAAAPLNPTSLMLAPAYAATTAGLNLAIEANEAIATFVVGSSVFGLLFPPAGQRGDINKGISAPPVAKTSPFLPSSATSATTPATPAPPPATKPDKSKPKYR
jgi:hypothetical protein